MAIHTNRKESAECGNLGQPVPWMVYQVHSPIPSSWITSSRLASVALTTPRTSN
jgi:hypothetical protein